MSKHEERNGTDKCEDLQALLFDAAVEEAKKHIDIDLLRANLKLTVEQRLENLMFLQFFAEDLAKRLEAILCIPHRRLCDSGSY